MLFRDKTNKQKLQRKLKQRRKRKQASRSEQVRSVESLEARQLLTAVTHDGNFVSNDQVNTASVGAGTPAVVQLDVAPGYDKAIVVTAVYTDTEDVTLTVKDISNPAFVPAGVTPVNDTEASASADVIRPVTIASDNTTMTTAIWVIDIDDVNGNPNNFSNPERAYNAMDRVYEIKLAGGDSTDIWLGAASYSNVDQVNPVHDGGRLAAVASGSVSTIEEGGAPATPSNGRIDVPTDSRVVDVFLGRESAPGSITPQIPATQTLLASHTMMIPGLEYDIGSSTQGEDSGAANDDMVWNALTFHDYDAMSHSAVVLAACDNNCHGTVYFDFGDAPDSYKTTVGSDGARHARKGPQLGELRDHETNAQATLDGSGDNNNGTDDEDGVTQSTGAVAGDLGDFEFVTQKNVNNTAKIDIEVTGLESGQNGYVTGWIDWNNDGSFNASEEFTGNETFTGNGTKTITVTIPKSGDSSLHQPASGKFETYMRVRVHSRPMASDPQFLGPSGRANDGEVEDYPVSVYLGGEVEGTKYHDVNGDGDKDPEDAAWTYGADGQPAGAPFVVKDGVLVGLYTDSAGTTKAKDLYGDDVDPVVTASDGTYRFPNMPDGKYYVVEWPDKSDTNDDGVFDTGTFLHGEPIDQGLRWSNGDSIEVNLDLKECEKVDLFDYVTGSIHGRKFHDIDADGNWDYDDKNSNGIWDNSEPGEQPLENVQYTLYEYVGTETYKILSSTKTFTVHEWKTYTKTTKTDAKGHYWFDHLDPGKYEIFETDSNGYPGLSTGQHTTPPTAATVPIPIPGGSFYSNQGPGKTFVVTSGLEFISEAGGHMMEVDLNGNGLRDPQDDEFPVVAVALKTTQQDDYLEYGNYKWVSIHGFKYEDVNYDADKGFSYDVDDVPMPGADFELLYDSNNDGDWDSVVPNDWPGDNYAESVGKSSTMGAEGEFWFEGLKPGKYWVRERSNSDSNNDKTADVDQDLILDPHVAGPFTLTSGESAGVTGETHNSTSLRFGNYINGSIHGFKFHDLDADGLWDFNEDKNYNGSFNPNPPYNEDANNNGKLDTEPGLGGVEFSLYKFVRTIKTTHPSSTPTYKYEWELVAQEESGPKGHFWFTGLDHGTYELFETDSGAYPGTSTNQLALPAGFSSTDPVGTKFVTDYDRNPSGNQQYEIVSRREFVWKSGESGGMGADNSLKNEVYPDGTVDGTPANPIPGKLDGNVSCGPGAGEACANALMFGNYQNASIHGFKFEDINNNGHDSADVPLAGADFELLNSSKSVIATAESNGDGEFWFMDLTPGTYYVRESASSDSNNDGKADSGQDMALDLALRGPFTLSSGESVGVSGHDTNTDSLKFGNYVYGSIHGFKYHDIDGDGNWDFNEDLNYDGSFNSAKGEDLNNNGKFDTEPGLDDVKFGLYRYVKKHTTPQPSATPTHKYEWEYVKTATTVNKGHFWFTELEPGKYEVFELNAGAYKGLSTGQGSLPADFVGKPVGASFQTTYDPEASTNQQYDIVSRKEYVWKTGESGGMGMDNALKNELFADGSPADKDADPVELHPGADACGPGEACSSELMFGNYVPGRIRGIKYEDINNNNTRELSNPFEPVMEGAVFHLTGSDNRGNTVSRYATSDANGLFWFDGLAPGTYYVNEDADKTDTDNDGTSDALQDMDIDDSKRGPFNVVSDLSYDQNLVTSATPPVPTSNVETVDNLDWGNYINGSIHGFKFHDYDGDGHWDYGEDTNKDGSFQSATGEDADNDGIFDTEPGLGGVEFTLLKLVRTIETTHPSSTPTYKYEWELVGQEVSGPKGHFWFTGLKPGTYEVFETDPGVYTERTTSQPTLPAGVDADAAIGTKFVTTYAGNGSYQYDIESRREYVWKSGESGGMDADNALKNEVYPGGSPSVKTAPGLLAPDWDLCKSEPNQACANDLMYGNRTPPVEIHGFKFHDEDGDGKYREPTYYDPDEDDPNNPLIQTDAGEPGLGNIWIGLADAAGTPIRDPYGDLVYTISMPNGEFWFEEPENIVPPGTYTFYEDLSKSDSNLNGVPDSAEGMAVSTLGGTITLAAGETVYWNGNPGVGERPTFNHDLIVGNYVLGSIHGFKYADLFANGVYDTQWGHGDIPFEWAYFELTDSDGNSMGIRRSDLGGEFEYLNLPPGTYTLTELLGNIDRDDLDRDGFADGDSTPDVLEGLAASTPTSVELTIRSGEELAWRPGAAGIPGTTLVSANPDSPAAATFTTESGGGTVTYGGPSGYSTDGDGDIIRRAGGGGAAYWHTSFDSRTLRVDLPVNTFTATIDVIGNNDTPSSTDQGVVQFFRPNGTHLSTQFTGMLGDGESETVSYTATEPIGFMLAGGFQETVFLDNVTYSTVSLKSEVVVGSDLMFGNYYSGSIHGRKVQDGTGAAAPNISFNLVDADGHIVDAQTTDVNGEYWFENVKPGKYTVQEVPSNSVILPGGVTTFPSRTVWVEYGQAISIDGSHPSNGPWPTHDLASPSISDTKAQPGLEITNKIRGSIHGVVQHGDSGKVIPGIDVRLIGPSSTIMGTNTTNAAGEFWFEDLAPGIYQVVELDSGAPTLDPFDSAAIQVDSGEEHVAYLGQADGHLDPGQFEVGPDSHLTFHKQVEGSIHGVVVSATEAPVSGVTVTLANGSGIVTTTTNAAGQFNFDGLAPGEYDVVPSGAFGPAANVIVSSGEEEVGVSGQAPLETGQYETVNPSLIFKGTTDMAPAVTQVRVAGQYWAQSFRDHVDSADGLGYSIPTGADQEKALPWDNINRLYVDFSEDVTLSGSDVALFGQSGQVAIATSYDAVAHRLTISTAANLPRGRYSLVVDDSVTDATSHALDGEWSQFGDTYPSGDGTAGGRFVLHFNVSPGDYTRSVSGFVNVFDLSELGVAFGTQPGGANYSPYADANGSGLVNVFDLSILGVNWGKQLSGAYPTVPATLPAVPSGAAAFDAVFGDLDDDDDVLSPEVEEFVPIRRFDRFV